MPFPYLFPWGFNRDVSTSLQSMRQTLAKWLGAYREAETTSAGAANGTTVVCSSLADMPDDHYNTHFLKAIDVTNAPVRRAKDFTNSTGTIEVWVAFAAQVATDKTMEIHEIDPDLIDEAIKQTLKTIYPRLYVAVRDESLITGNWLRNGSFEDWAATTNPDDWGKSTNATLAKETAVAYVRNGLSALKITAAAATQYAYQSQAEHPELLDLRGETVRLRAWLWTATASNARLQIWDKTEGGTATTTSSSWHGGGSAWELLEVERTLPAALFQVEFRITAAVNTAITYADHARAFGATQYHFYLPSSFKRLDQVWVQTSGRQQDSTTGETLDPCDDLLETYPFILLPPARPGVWGWRLVDDGTDKIIHLEPTAALNAEGYKIRLTGIKGLTAPSTDAGTSEIDSPQVDFVLAMAARRLRTMIPRMNDQLRERFNAIEAQVPSLSVHTRIQEAAG